MKIIILAIGLLAVFAGILICLRQFCVEKPPPIIVASQGPTIERLEKLSQLLVSRVHIADVLVGVSDDSKGAFLIRGDALIGLDLSKAVITEKDDSARRATLLLPQPRVILARVDGLESLILAHACAGVDVESPAYVEGIETAVEAITNHFT